MRCQVKLPAVIVVHSDRVDALAVGVIAKGQLFQIQHPIAKRRQVHRAVKRTDREMAAKGLGLALFGFLPDRRAVGPQGLDLGIVVKVALPPLQYGIGLRRARGQPRRRRGRLRGWRRAAGGKQEGSQPRETPRSPSTQVDDHGDSPCSCSKQRSRTPGRAVGMRSQHVLIHVIIIHICDRTVAWTRAAPMNRRQFLARSVAAASAALARPLTAATAPRRSAFGDLDVIVLGAGLAGLNATLLLEEIGLKTLLIEGRDRVGGRLYTLDDVPGAPEAGGSGIGSMYGRLLDAAKRYEVPLGPERRRTVPVREISMMNIRGQNIRFDDWARHALNPLPEAYREQLPWYVPYSLYAEDNPLTATVQVTDPKFAPHDRSVYEYLTSRGFNEEAIRLAAGTNMSYGDHEGPHGLSALMMYHILAFGGMSNSNIKGSPFAGQGGNQRIPEGMARAVKHDLQLGLRAVGIRDGRDRAEVQLEDGRVVRAKRIIVTAPFSALRLCALDAPLHPLQRQAIYRLGYTNVTQLHFEPTRKFWEEDGLPPSMWTDSPAARFMALRNDPANPKDITSFIAFANDRVANQLDRLGAQGSSDYVLGHLAQLRPSTKGALRFVKFWSWQLDPFAGGAYAAWRPGQLSTMARSVAQPAGRIHFAGEHTAFANRGMEAAMESGERAALEVATLG